MPNATYVKSTSLVASSTSPCTSPSITPTTPGDALICVAIGQGTGTWGTCTNSLGSTVITDASTAHFAFFRVASCAAGAQSFSVAFTGFSKVLVTVIEASAVRAFDQITAEGSGSSTTPATPALTPAATGELLIAGIRTGAGTATFSAWTNGFTQSQANTNGPSVADGYLTDTASPPVSISTGATLSVSESWISILAAYSAAAAPTVTSVNGGSPIPEGATNVPIVGTGFAAGMTAAITQPNGCTVSQPITYVSATSATINLTVEPGTGNQLAFTDATHVTDFTVTAGGVTSAAVTITVAPPAGLIFETLGTPNANSPYRITASPDLVAGNQLEASGNASGATAAPTGLTINSDATWDFTAGNTPANFYVRAYDQSTFTWGAWALQSVIAVTTRSQWMPFQMACRLRVLQQGSLDVGNTRQNIANLLSLATTEANGAAGWAKWRTVLNTAKVPGNLRINVPQVPGYTAPP